MKDQTILCLKEKTTINILTVLVVVLLISQGLIIYFVLIKANQAVDRANALESNFSRQIQSTNKNVQSISAQINTLSDSITSITSTQSDIKKQVYQIQASTSSDFSGIIEDSIRGTVTIKTDVAQGTGFLVTDDGYIITNAHVLSGAHLANAYTYDNQAHAVTLIGYDDNLDVALLKISGSFQSLSLGDSDSVKIGEKVIAIGNPLGLSFSTSEGIISARDRQGDNNLPDYFQTDASLNPGNSGGPLIDTQGKVIGINNFKVSGAENIGFALEINYAKSKVNDLALKALNQTII